MALKVFNFKCEFGHTFEAMVPNLQELDRQLAAGWLSCPICGSKNVERMLSAPYVVRGNAKPTDKSQTTVDEVEKSLQEIDKLVKGCENVGENFADEARSIHYGQKPARSIKGLATTEEFADLLDEGVPVVPIGVKKGNPKSN